MPTVPPLSRNTLNYRLRRLNDDYKRLWPATMNDFGERLSKILTTLAANLKKFIDSGAPIGPKKFPDPLRKTKIPGKNQERVFLEGLFTNYQGYPGRENTGAGATMTICHKFARFWCSGGARAPVRVFIA